MKRRQASLTDRLAFWYVETFLNRPFDYRGDKKYLKLAKEFVNPERDPYTGKVPLVFTVEEVKGCLLALKDGSHPSLKGKAWTGQLGFHNLWWGDPPYIVEWTAAPEIPAVYDSIAYDDWVRQWGKRAIEQGKWDGEYCGWTINREDGLPFEELEEIVGWEKADSALRGYYEELNKRREAHDGMSKMSKENGVDWGLE